MAVRHILLAVSAVAVLAMMVFLALAVGAASDPVTPGAPVTASREDSSLGEPADDADPAQPTRPSRTRPRAGRIRDDASAPPPRGDPGAPIERVPPPPGAPDKDLEQLMASANKAYDRGDLEVARTMASQALEQAPDNTRMLRVMVSAHCMEGEGGEATKYFDKLGTADQEQMRTRCDRYGVTFK